jgi:hypothetical protein
MPERPFACAESVALSQVQKIKLLLHFLQYARKRLAVMRFSTQRNREVTY